MCCTSSGSVSSILLWMRGRPSCPIGCSPAQETMVMERKHEVYRDSYRTLLHCCPSTTATDSPFMKMSLRWRMQRGEDRRDVIILRAIPHNATSRGLRTSITLHKIHEQGMKSKVDIPVNREAGRRCPTSYRRSNWTKGPQVYLGATAIDVWTTS